MISCHREENIDANVNFNKLIDSLNKISEVFKIPVIFPIHPRTESKIKKKIKIPKNIKLIKPLGFFEFSKLEQNAFCLITDSGTVPEESFYFKVPSITIRETTERPEFIEAGFNIISGL